MIYHFLVESKPHERIDLLIIPPPLFVQILKTRPPPLILGGGLWSCTQNLHIHTFCTQTYHLLKNCHMKWLSEMTMLLKGRKPDKFESHISLKLSFTNIRGLCSNFVKCESFVKSSSPDILALFKTNLDDLIDFDNLSMRSFLSLIQKDSVTHIYGLSVCMKEGLPFPWNYL